MYKNDGKCVSCCAGTKMSANHDEKDFCFIMYYNVLWFFILFIYLCFCHKIFHYIFLNLYQTLLLCRDKMFLVLF